MLTFIFLISILVGYLSFSIYKNAFIGVLISQNSEGQYVVTDHSSKTHWGFGRIFVGDVITEVDGQPAKDFFSIKTYGLLERASTIHLSRIGEDGSLHHIQLHVDNQLSLNELMIQLFSPLTAVLIFSGLSFFVYRRKKGDPAAVQLILFFLSIGIAYLSSLSSGRADPIGRLTMTFTILLVPIFFLQFMSYYLRRYQETIVNRRCLGVLYAVICIIMGLNLSKILFNFGSPMVISTLILIYFIGINIYIIFRLVQKFLAHRHGGPLKSLFKLILIGHVTGFFPFVFLFAVPQLFGISFLSPEIAAVFLLTIPIVYLYMFTTNQLFDIDFLINRVLYYASLSFLPTLVISALAALLLSQDNHSWVKWSQLFLVCYLLVTLMLFLKEYADLKLRPRLNKDLHNFQGSLNRFSARISRVMKRSDLERVLEQEIYHVLPVKKVAFLEVDTDRLPELKLDPSLADIRESVISAVQASANQLVIGTVLNVERGICVIAGKKLNILHVLWLDVKGNRTKYNLDELAWLRTLANYSAIVYENLYLIESLVEELELEFQKQKGADTSPWLLRLIFKLSEKERRKLASDLHDSALQDQLIWYRNLESAMLDHDMSPELYEKLVNVREGLLDVIHQIRETCNELRPPLLQEMGIIEALEGLFEQAQIRSNYIIDFRYGVVTADINDEQLLTIFRIVQELLRNASKHAKASHIRITLEQQRNDIRLTYMDDGIGLKLEDLKDSYQHMGLSGIKERVHSMEGVIDFKSEPGSGLEVEISLPLESVSWDRESEGDSDGSHLAG